jgi:hypothetical protein
MKPTDYRQFRRSGVKVSPLALGCMMFGRRTELDDSIRIIDRARDVGIDVLDTANVYGHGRSEQITGEALKRNSRRCDVFLCTKVDMVMNDDDPNARGISRRHVIESAKLAFGASKPIISISIKFTDRNQVPRSTRRSALSTIWFPRAISDPLHSRPGKWSRRLGEQGAASRTICFGEAALQLAGSEDRTKARAGGRDLRSRAHSLGPLGGGIMTGKFERGKSAPLESRYADPDRQQHGSSLCEATNPPPAK